jgi:hypothetical protein
LVFKLLLISAVVEPDTLDLLILLSWYTLLSFLRSLAHLEEAGHQREEQMLMEMKMLHAELLVVTLACISISFVALLYLQK